MPSVFGVKAPVDTVWLGLAPAQEQECGVKQTPVDMVCKEPVPRARGFTAQVEVEMVCKEAALLATAFTARIQGRPEPPPELRASRRPRLRTRTVCTAS